MVLSVLPCTMRTSLLPSFPTFTDHILQPHSSIDVRYLQTHRRQNTIFISFFLLMALASSSSTHFTLPSSPSSSSSSSSSSHKNPSKPLFLTHVLLNFPSTSSHKSPKPKPLLRISANSTTPKARFIARRRESVSVSQLERPLSEYMSLPASQYSVLDAERIERIDDNTFRCYVYTIKFFNFEVCPVLLVKVEEQPNGCCINLLSCKLEGSPIVVAQNEKFDANMVNQISCSSMGSSLSVQQLTSDTVIEVTIDVPFAFRAFPVQAIESTGAQVLEQILKLMLPRFMGQLVKDYQAWASGDASRQPLGTGEI